MEDNPKQLKKCVKCGADGIVAPEPSGTMAGTAYWYNGCTNLFCANFDLDNYFSSEQEAIDDWNKRQKEGGVHGPSN